MSGSEGVDGAGGVAVEAETKGEEPVSEASSFGEWAEGRLESVLESLLFAAGGPLSVRKLADLLGGLPKAELQRALTRLQERYAHRGIRLCEVAGGFQFRTAPENSRWVRGLIREKPARLGRAALETLAIIAYKQPCTKAEIEAVRGVDADGAIASLLEKRLIRIAGRKETVGRPILYATTPEFLLAFGLKDLRDLPALQEIESSPDENSDAGENDGAEEAAGAVAEDSEPGGTDVAPQGREPHPGGAGEGERAGGLGTGSEGGSAAGPDPG